MTAIVLQGDRGSAGPMGARNEGSALTSFNNAGEGEGMAAAQVSSFKASDGWVYKFIQCNCFTLRAKHRCHRSYMYLLDLKAR